MQIRIGAVPKEESDTFMSQTFTVAGDGSITLPYVGQITVGGLTFYQAERIIERTYISQKIYQHPAIFIQYLDPWRSERLDAPGSGYREQSPPNDNERTPNQLPRRAAQSLISGS